MRRQDLEMKLLECAVRRDDRRYMPLLVQVCDLASKGYDVEYVIDCCHKYYDGGDLDGCEIDRSYQDISLDQRGKKILY